MRSVLIIGHLDIRLFLRDRAAYFWLFGAPLLFIYFFGMANPPPGDPSNPLPGVLLENRDTGDLGALVVEALGQQGIAILGEEDRESARRGIRIAEDFSDRIRAGEAVKVTFFKIEESPEAIESMVEFRLTRALVELNTLLFQHATTGGELADLEAGDLLPGIQQADRVALEVRFGTRQPMPAGFNQTLPGMLVMFLLMNLMIIGASSISQDRLNGVIKRLAVQPVRHWQLVTGKVYGRFLLSLLQIGFLLLFGQFVLDVPISQSPLAVVVVLLLFSWMAAALGVLVGSLVTSPEKTYGICIGGSMVMAALGGCWWPMEVVPDTMRLIGQIFPTTWAMEALHQVITFGGDLRHVLPEIGVILLFAVASQVAASLSFRTGS